MVYRASVARNRIFFQQFLSFFFEYHTSAGVRNWTLRPLLVSLSFTLANNTYSKRDLLPLFFLPKRVKMKEFLQTRWLLKWKKKTKLFPVLERFGGYFHKNEGPKRWRKEARGSKSRTTNCGINVSLKTFWNNAIVLIMSCLWRRRRQRLAYVCTISQGAGGYLSSIRWSRTRELKCGTMGNKRYIEIFSAILVLEKQIIESFIQENIFTIGGIFFQIDNFWVWVVFAFFCGASTLSMVFLYRLHFDVRILYWK